LVAKLVDLLSVEEYGKSTSPSYSTSLVFVNTKCYELKKIAVPDLKAERVCSTLSTTDIP
jgi:hypothetical protein